MNKFSSIRPAAVPHHYMILHGRYPVLVELIDLVCAQLRDVEIWLRPGKRYTAHALMGDPCWGMLTTGEKRLAGSVISHLAGQGDLPILKVEKRTIGEANSYVWTDDAAVDFIGRHGLRVAAASGTAECPAARGRSLCLS